MEQYIPKSALLAEIERLVNNYDKALDYEAALEDVRNFIDSLQEEPVREGLEEAVDGVITFDYYGDDDKTYGCIAHDSFCLEDFGLKDTDKVKMILIKED